MKELSVQIKKKLFVDSNPYEIRLAVVEDGRLAEFYIERRKDRGITGNIYRGKVVRVLPGMQAAFVEIGLERTAFLHVTDVLETVDILEDEGKEEDKGSPQQRIQDLLVEGQEVLVQVEKEPIGTKGARLTSYAALPGRYLVLMPTYRKTGISRRIGDEKERRRLRDIVRGAKPPEYGFIIRTACEGMTREEIVSDMNYLVKLWQNISGKMEITKAPTILYEELDLTLRSLRDIFTPETEGFIIDSKEEYERALTFTREFMPELSPSIELYDGKEAMFDVYGIDVELANALSKKVWLPSGGYLVIDQMEALTAIDVNTGKYVGKKNPEATVVKTNLEAAIEVVRQLRLRNIGGIIVIDFIDMLKFSDREKVYGTLKDALKKDKARTNILKISDLGIVEMTRKRVRESIMQSLLEACPYCEGDGMIKGKDTIAMEIYRDLVREFSVNKKKKVVVYANPVLAERIKEIGYGEELKQRFSGKVVVKAMEGFHHEEYEIL